MLAGLELNGINSISCTCRVFKTGGNLDCANLLQIYLENILYYPYDRMNEVISLYREFFNWNIKSNF